jgi:hypothetical protein
MPILVLIEGDMLKEKLQAKVDVQSLEDFKAAVGKVAKVSIDKFDLKVLNTEYGEWCAPVGFDSLGETVKAKLVVKQQDEDNTFAIDPSNFNKFQAPSYVFFLSTHSLLLPSSSPLTTSLFLILCFHA